MRCINIKYMCNVNIKFKNFVLSYFSAALHVSLIKKVFGLGIKPTIGGVDLFMNKLLTAVEVNENVS